ncbi:hypothetical protein BD309DRAFT_851085 [Dichomitus squalens]|nr:hypothetical protein BD309DRAFT_851085 [Dichomitus squalens]
MGGALTVYFLMSTYKAIQYTRTVNVKNKALFYMLVVSQAIGIFVSVFFVIADFSSAVDCTATGMLKKGGVLVSTTLLVPGILGTKAYRCLNNAGFVIVVLAVTRAAIIAVSGVVIAEYKGGRRFTGTCETVRESSLLPLSIILQFVEACFICFCFLWAVYRSYRGPADHARLSLPLDEEDETSSVGTNEKEDDDHRAGTSRRGWWDYVPNALPEMSAGRGSPYSTRSSPGDMMGRFRRWWSGEPMLPSTVFQRKPSIPGEIPLSQPPRISSVSSVGPRVSISREAVERQPRASSPPPPSVMERIIRYVPRAELLRNMLKNELLYTTFITTVLFVISIVMLVGVTQQLLLGANSWSMLDWLIISMCTMHSFSRVARRHEREAWLQDPANWRSMHHAQVEDDTALRPKHPHRTWSPVSVRSSWRHRYRERGESDDRSTVGRYRSTEFSEPPLSPSRPSWASRVRSTSLTRSPADLPSISRSTSIASSPMPSMDSLYRAPLPRHGRGSPMVLPSPEFPPTNTSTPQSDSQSFSPRTGHLPTILRSPVAASRRRSSSEREKRPASPPPPSPRRSSRDWDPENPEPPDPARTL